MIRLIQAQDPDVLNVRQDLSHIPDASGFSTGAIMNELGVLAQQLEVAKSISILGSPEPIAVDTPSSGGAEDAPGSLAIHESYPMFLRFATAQLELVHAEVGRVQHKYRDILNYFGEDTDLGSDVFFQTLNNFGASFEQAVAEVRPPPPPRIRALDICVQNALRGSKRVFLCR